ncbi:MAG: cyclase family protein [Alphaproteobacteria bacterium]
MGRWVEMSRIIENNMAGINPRYSVRVRPFLTHEATGAQLEGQASFEVSEVAFPVPIGTYIDSPFTRDPDGRDIGALGIDELVLPGLALDFHGHGARAHAPVLPQELPPPAALKGRAILFDFGRAAHYGTPAYDETAPYLPRATVEALIDAGVRLVGVDSRSPDDARDLSRPAHTLLLRANIFIVENLINLDEVRGRAFRFFAIPARVRGATSFPIRAFAECLE